MSASSAASSAAKLAGKGIGGLFSLAKSGVNAVSSGISSASESMQEHSEASTLEKLAKAGPSPVTAAVTDSFIKLVHLLAATYDQEAMAVASAASKRFMESKRVTFADALSVGAALQAESLMLGKFDQSTATKALSGFVKTMSLSSAPKSHPDRDEMRDALALSLIYLVDAASAQVEAVVTALAANITANPVGVDTPKWLGQALYGVGAALLAVGKAGEAEHNKQLAEAQRVMEKEQSRAAASAAVAAPK